MGNESISRLHLPVDHQEYHSFVTHVVLLVKINFDATLNRKTFASGEKEFTQVSSGVVSQSDGWSQFSVNFTLETDLTSNAAALDIYIG